MDWQPIETAPKDGSLVLLWTPMYIKRMGAALPLCGYWHGSQWGIVNADAAMQRVEPTHWMPLPPAPGHEAQRSEAQSGSHCEPFSRMGAA